MLAASVLGLLQLRSHNSSGTKNMQEVPLDYFDLKTGKPPADPQSAACFWRGLATEADGQKMKDEMDKNHSEMQELAATMMLKKVLEGCHEAGLKRPTDNGRIGSKRDTKAMLSSLPRSTDNMKKLIIATVNPTKDKSFVPQVADQFLSMKNMVLSCKNLPESIQNHHSSNRGGFGVAIRKAKADWLKNNIYKPMEDNNSWHFLPNQPRAKEGRMAKKFEKVTVEVNGKCHCMCVVESRTIVSFVIVCSCVCLWGLTSCFCFVIEAKFEEKFQQQTKF